MAESKEASQTSDLPPPAATPVLEVTCKSSGIVRRFAPGTKADFALSLINNKLDVGTPVALYIEAAKSGEEPINFGPSSVLLSYGNGWKLQTVLDSQQGIKEHEGSNIRLTTNTSGLKASNTKAKRQDTEPAFDILYIGKIVIAFLFIFWLAGIFTLALENLPKLMLLINSSL